MDERLRFIARVLDGERMSDVCHEFSISRKTDYKFLKRYRSEGPIRVATDRVAESIAGAIGRGISCLNPSKVFGERKERLSDRYAR